MESPVQIKIGKPAPGRSIGDSTIDMLGDKLQIKGKDITTTSRSNNHKSLRLPKRIKSFDTSGALASKFAGAVPEVSNAKKAAMSTDNNIIDNNIDNS